MKKTLLILNVSLIALLLAPVTSYCSDEQRVWALNDGRSVEASFVATIGSNYVLKSPGGKQIKVPVDLFSDEDKVFIQLLTPPKIKVDVIRNLKTVTFTQGWYGEFGREPEQHGNFGFRVKQTSSGSYPHELTAEYFFIGRQLYRSDPKCYVLDRGEVVFTLSEESDKSFQYMSDRNVRLQNWEYDGGNSSFIIQYGEVYYASVLVITDQRGEVIHLKASKSWMGDNLDNLRQLKVGNYFDKNCVRCFPGRPEPLVW